MSSLLGRSKQGEKGRPDIVSRVKTVQIVLDSAGAAQLVRSRAPRGQSSNGNGNQATAGIDETLTQANTIGPPITSYATRALLPVQSQPLGPLSNCASESHPSSLHRPFHGAKSSKSSTSSIDPPAQYHQDPDARLKLRMYLASTQKFGELRL
ncbi:hypothetical protein MYU51_013889 [Penicillium brevicompactum]